MVSADKSRTSAKPFIPAPSACGHAVQFYQAESELLDTVAGLVGGSLQADGVALMVATRAHREGLLAGLAARGIETATAIGEQRLILLDAAEMLARFMVDGRPDAVLFDRVVGGAVRRASAVGGGRRPFVFGEMVALLWDKGAQDAAISLERLWNGLAASHAFFLHCAYPLHSFNRADHAPALVRICHAHRAVVPC